MEEEAEKYGEVIGEETMFELGDPLSLDFVLLWPNGPNKFGSSTHLP